MIDKQVIREYIHKQKKNATPDEKRAWGLLQMWNDTRAFPQFEAMVRFSLKDVEEELKKPYDSTDDFEVNWHESLERDVRVFMPMVKFLDEQKAEEKN